MGAKVVTFVSSVAHAFNVFDIKGRAIVGLFTLTIIALSVWATLTGSDLPSGVLTAYGTVIAGLTVNKTFETKPAAPKGVKAEC